MLFGPWAERKPATGKWMVHLPEDKSSIAHILLAIIHGKYDLVPDWTAMTEGLLSDIVVFADKYDIFHVLRPWAQKWVKSVMAGQHPLFSLTPLCSPERVMQLSHIAWELGCEQQLVSITRRLILGTSKCDMQEIQKLKDRGILWGPPDLFGKRNRDSFMNNT